MEGEMGPGRALKTSAAPNLQPDRQAAAELEREAQLLEMSVPGMRGHSRRVAVYAALTAQRMGLEAAAVARIRRAGALHDIGKAELVQSHAIAGARVVSV